MNDEGEAVMWVRVCTVGSNYKIKGSKYIVLSVSHQQENVNRTCEKWTRPVIIIMTYSWTPFPKELACSCCKWPSSSVVFDKSRYLFDMPHLCNQVGGWKRQIIWLIWVSMHDGKELFGKSTWFSAEIVVNARMSLVDFKIANYIGFLGAYIFEF